MKIADLLQMQMGDAIDWLEKYQHDIVLAPRELTTEIRIAFHDSMEKHEDGEEIEGCPDDQWNAMVDVIEAT